MATAGTGDTAGILAGRRLASDVQTNRSLFPSMPRNSDGSGTVSPLLDDLRGLPESGVPPR